MYSLPVFVLLLLTVTTGATAGILRGVYSKTNPMTGKNLWRFNFFQNLACCCTIAAIGLCSGFSFHFSLFSVLLGVLLAAANILSILFMLKAQAIGPFSYTTVIVSLSAIIPTFSGMLFFRERVSWIQMIGVGLMICCILLSPEHHDDESRSVGLRWITCCALAFIGSGTTGVTQKFHQNSAEHHSEFAALLLTCMFLSMLFSGFELILEHKKNPTDTPDHPTRSQLLIPLIAGLCFAFPHTINLFLSGKLPAIVFFPIVNLCPMLLQLLYAVLIFKEKLSLRRKIGILFGILATIVISGIIG